MDAPDIDYDLRPATADDLAFLRDLHHRTMRPYVERYWGWHDDQQDAFVRQSVADKRPAIIVVNGRDVGQLTIAHTDRETILEQIVILPEFQRRGLGTAVIRGLIADADDRGLPLLLKVFKANPARRLYERFGFEAEMEDDTSVYMRRPVGGALT
jgi:GNAT superfamily N-acetyltransferase